MDEIEVTVNRLGKRIREECRAIRYNQLHYKLDVDKEIAPEEASETLERLSTAISPKLFCGNIVTSVVTNHPTILQITLAVQMREPKTRIQLMNQFHVTYTYDELCCFLKSAAVLAAAGGGIDALREPTGMIQFDLDISTQNEKVNSRF